MQIQSQVNPRIIYFKDNKKLEQVKPIRGKTWNSFTSLQQKSPKDNGIIPQSFEKKGQ